MSDEEFLRELASALTRQEDLSDSEARDVLYELALRIYALLLSRYPAPGLLRQLEWPALRAEILTLLSAQNETLAQLLFTRLAAAEAITTELVARYYGLRRDQLPPRRVTELLDRTRVLQTPVGQLFLAPGAGVSPFTQQLMRLLERSLGPSFFDDTPTPEVAEKVIELRRRGREQYGVAVRGTVANGWRERWRSIVAAAIWSTVSPAQYRAAAASGDVRSWRWNAVLDPRTCPVCRPLDGTEAAAPDLFPQGPPPLHPRCRCILVPQMST